MIKFDKFAIDADEYGYQAGYLKTRNVTGKDGETIVQEFVYKPLFYTTVQIAIQGLLSREQRVMTSNTEMDLKAALRAFDALQSRFENYLSAVHEELKR